LNFQEFLGPLRRFENISGVLESKPSTKFQEIYEFFEYFKNFEEFMGMFRSFQEFLKVFGDFHQF
jgi:hypothetical protein